MIFKETPLPGAYLIDLEPLGDDRGFFARSYCQNEFAEHRLKTNVAQCNISFNSKKGTVRGMHFQIAPHEEAKLVRCTLGVIYDVIIDLRTDSSTRGQWFGTVLSCENRRMLHIPEGFAHGFQTLKDNTEVFYQMSEFFAPECARGVRWNDPAFDIKWPEPVKNLSKKDQEYPDYTL